MTYVFVGYVRADRVQPGAPARCPARRSPARFIPTGYLFLDTASFLPVGPVASTLYDYTGAVFWT